jgi:prevent-host-death family protein
MFMNSPSKNIGLKDLRENMGTYIDRVNQGESLTIFRRSTPLFKITPIDDVNEDNWETVIDFVKETGHGVPIAELLSSIKTYGQKSKVS